MEDRLQKIKEKLQEPITGHPSREGEQRIKRLEDSLWLLVDDYNQGLQPLKSNGLEGKSTGEIIRHKRKELGLSQKQLAKELGITEASISKIENDKQNLTIANLKRLCDIFWCSSTDLLGF